MPNSLLGSRIPNGITAAQIAAASGCTRRDGDDASTVFNSVSTLENVSSGGLTCVDDTTGIVALGNTKAAVVICTQELAGFVPLSAVALVSQHPYQSFATALTFLFPNGNPVFPRETGGISASAKIDPTATLEDDVTVEADVVIGAGVMIGSGSLIGRKTIIGRGVKIGRGTSIADGTILDNALIGNNVVVHAGACIGMDTEDQILATPDQGIVPPVGRVVIQDKVEIGAMSRIKCAGAHETIVGEGSRIDDNVIVGSQTILGRSCVAFTGAIIADNSSHGDYSVFDHQLFR